MKKILLKLSVLGLLLMLFAGVNSIEANGQSKGGSKSHQPVSMDWQIFSPPDRRFTVEAPEGLRHTKNPDPGPNGVEDEWFLDLFKCTNKVDFYVLDLKSA